MQAVVAARRVAEDRDQAGHRRQKRRRGEQCPDHRDDEQERLLALQLRLAAGALAHVDRHLLDAKARVVEPQDGLDLRRAALVRLRERGERLRRRGVEAARRVVEGAAERDLHRSAQQTRAELPDPLRLVAVGLVARAADEARADGDVGAVRLDELEQLAQLGRRVLAVRVDPPAVGVLVLERPGVAGGDPRPQAAVLAEREHLGAVLARDVGGAIGRAVVDDEHVRSRELLVQLVEHGGEVVLLVPGGDEDQRVVTHRARVTPAAEGASRYRAADPFPGGDSERELDALRGTPRPGRRPPRSARRACSAR